MIIRDADICGGRPTVKGRRITVSDIIYRIMVDGLPTTILDLELQKSEITETLDYCSTLECTKNGFDCNFCLGCEMLLSQTLNKDCRASDLQDNLHKYWLVAKDLKIKTVE